MWPVSQLSVTVGDTLVKIRVLIHLRQDRHTNHRPWKKGHRVSNTAALNSILLQSLDTQLIGFLSKTFYMELFCCKLSCFSDGLTAGKTHFNSTEAVFHLQSPMNWNIASHCHCPTMQITLGRREIQPPVSQTEPVGFTRWDFVPPQPETTVEANVIFSMFKHMLKIQI